MSSMQLLLHYADFFITLQIKEIPNPSVDGRNVATKM